MDVLEPILDDEGVYIALTPFGQGFRDFSFAVDTLEAFVLSRHLQPDTSPVLTWAFQNIELATDPSGNRKFNKKTAIDRIDPMIALAMACAIAQKDNNPTIDFSNALVAV
jgi:phage terminase large subunit-like protein